MAERVACPRKGDVLLFDQLTQTGYWRASGANRMDECRTLEKLFAEAVVVRIDNVDDYYAEQRRVGAFNGKLFRAYMPTIAPPYEVYFMEASQGGRPAGCRMGVLHLAVDAEEQDAERFGPGVRWLMGQWIFAELESLSRIVLAGRTTYGVKGDGELCNAVVEVSAYDKELGTPEHLALAERLLEDYCYPCFLATSFLHCKNVVTTLNEPTLNRAARRRGDKPGVKYYTLEIEPMKEVLRREGGIEQHGLQRALHLCRGHFATYDETRPLFGKYAGTFWRPMHVRGHASQGIIDKDYAVKAPNG